MGPAAGPLSVPRQRLIAPGMCACADAASREPCLRPCATNCRRCFLGMRRHSSDAVSTTAKRPEPPQREAREQEEPEQEHRHQATRIVVGAKRRAGNFGVREAVLTTDTCRGVNCER